MERKEIPVLLLTGYLGSGKTTLLNRILRNEKGIRFAVIVNDIGEINIDASLIQKGGVVGKKEDDGDLVALQNGCICCTLQTDLIDQLSQLARSGRFDYIVIEASGICEPAPIAQTICAMAGMADTAQGGALPRLDCIVTVVDALRMQSEFDCGDGLKSAVKGEEDIENLVIQQIEFCNVILLNKISEVTPEEAGRIRAIIRAIQPKAKIIDCNYADVDSTKSSAQECLTSRMSQPPRHGSARSRGIIMMMKRMMMMMTMTTTIIITITTIPTVVPAATATIITTTMEATPRSMA